MSAPLQKLGNLAWREDKFDGVIIEPPDISEPEAFRSALGEAIDVWRSMEKRGVWLKLHKTQSALIPIAVAQGMDFHHTKGEDLMLTLWLPESQPSTLPFPPFHQVGIGACVINSKGEILTVVEKNGPLRGKGVRKIPTGLCDPGEDCHVAAEREVLEETGLTVRFESVLAIRQAHGFAFGNSDLFFLTALRLEDEGQEIMTQPSEIEEASFVPFEEYASQECWKDHQVMQSISEVIRRYISGSYKGLKGEKLTAGSLYMPGSKQRSDLLLTFDPKL
jgi:ADP-ribose pyrophosphatase YjhB (NUDIX family)